LLRAKKSWNSGECNAAKIVAAAQEEFAEEKSVRLDYFEIVDPDNLDPLDDVANGALVAVAAFVGQTRLIDNLVLPKRSQLRRVIPIN
jgi:pantothenate synthetase